jgi:4'-phosphopantetheinyl transferase
MEACKLPVQTLRESSLMKPWLPAPDPIPPLGEAVHVWAVELDDSNFDAALWHSRLSLEEQARAAGFKFARDHRRYVIAHAALRAILAGYANTVPKNLQFNEGPNGKPKLAPPFDASGIEFNLSHSHERALVAVKHVDEVGVDIEFAKVDFEFLDVASHFFTQREVTALRALPPALQRQAFYKCWTSKEAFLKAKGTGLSGELDEVEIMLVGEYVRINASVAGWSLVELPLYAGYEAALVTKLKPVEIHCYHWSAAW